MSDPNLLPRSHDRLEEVFRIALAIREEVAELRALVADRRKPQLTIHEFAALVGRSDYTCRRWVADGRVHAIRVQGTGPRGRLLIPRTELDRLLSEGKGEEIPPVALD